MANPSSLVGGNFIKDNAVSTAHIQDDAVVESKIVDKAVTPSKIDETKDYTVNALSVTTDANITGNANITGDANIENNLTAKGNTLLKGELSHTNSVFNLGNGAIKSDTDGNIVITAPAGKKLVLDGETTSVKQEDLEIDDKNIVLNKGGTVSTQEGAGITVEASDGDDLSMVFKGAKAFFGVAGAEIEAVVLSGTQTLVDKIYSLVGEDIFGKDNIEDAVREIADKLGGMLEPLNETGTTASSNYSDGVWTFGEAIQKSTAPTGNVLVNGLTVNPADYTIADDGTTLTFSDDFKSRLDADDVLYFGLVKK